VNLAPTDTRRTGVGRALRSGAFFVLYACYVIAIMGLGQHLLLWPAIVAWPRRRGALVGAWLRLHARATLAMARALAGVRLSVNGAIPAESCIVVMNHQSVLDIPLGLALIPGPQAVIPTRDRYRRGIPGISPLARLAGFPFVSQRRALTREELRAMTAVAERVARGERSLLIFPEGHRTRDGRIGRFMRSGLRLVLERARRPVYCIVADGMTRSRTTAEALARFAGTRVHATILGPFAPPDDLSSESIDRFIDSLHTHMIAALACMRGVPPELPDPSPTGVAPRSFPAR
jgi:1-acyl-sn-glycerol-3-phosphate acyltransferase